MGHILFKLNCGYYPQGFFKNEDNASARSFSANVLARELTKLMNAYYQYFLHIKNFQNQANNIRIKPQSYVPGEKV